MGVSKLSAFLQPHTVYNLCFFLFWVEKGRVKFVVFLYMFLYSPKLYNFDLRKFCALEEMASQCLPKSFLKKKLANRFVRNEPDSVFIHRPSI